MGESRTHRGTMGQDIQCGQVVAIQISIPANRELDSVNETDQLAKAENGNAA